MITLKRDVLFFNIDGATTIYVLVGRECLEMGIGVKYF